MDIGVAYSCLKYGVFITKMANLSPFRLGVGYVRDVVCLLGQLCQWFLMFSDYIKAS